MPHQFLNCLQIDILHVQASDAASQTDWHQSSDTPFRVASLCLGRSSRKISRSMTMALIMDYGFPALALGL
jgi:hypothetical protein